MRVKTGIGAAALILAAATAAAGELYRWVDEDGKVHFGDRPPAQAKAENIEGELRPINSADAATPRKTGAGQRADNIDREYENRQQQRQWQQQQRMARACNDARRKLRMLQGRVAFIDDSGDEIRMTERERQRLAAQLQGEIGRVCG